MKLGWIAAVAALVLALFVAVPTPPAEAVTLVEDVVLSDDGRLHELTLQSDALGRATKARILLPAGYDDPANADVRYPVLLLVHGANSDHASWTGRTDLEARSADDDVIIVMPDGGTLGFYSDWLNGPQWETYHLDELLPWVESTYRAIGTRAGRAIAGVSMGGFGAMSYATRHPDRFVAAASFSGVVDLTGLAAPEMAVIQTAFTPEPLWGSFLTHEANWRSHNPTDLAGNLGSMIVRHTTGTGIPCPGDNPAEGIIEAIILLMNVSLDHQLTTAGVDHELVVHPCGTHENHHFVRDADAWLTALDGIFAAPPPVPPTFDYRTAELDFDIWGWSFTAHRPAIELLDLRDVSAAGLTAVGSGPVDVVSPAVYEPGASYTVSSARAGVLTVPIGRVPALGTGTASPAASTTVLADGDGRLRFTVDLGPAHVANQFSPEGILAEALALGSYFQSATVTITPVADSTTSTTTPEAPTTTAPRSAAAGAGAGGTLPTTGGSVPLVPALIALAVATALWRARRALAAATAA